MMRYFLSGVLIGAVSGLWVIGLGTVMGNYELVERGFKVVFVTFLVGIPIGAVVLIYGIFNWKW